MLTTPRIAPKVPLALMLFFVVFLASSLLTTVSAREKDGSSPPDHGWLGVMMDKRPAIPDDADPDDFLGVSVRFVVDDGPAAKAGVRARDRILTLNGVPVNSPRELVEVLKQENPGNWVPMTLMRGEDDERDVRVRLDSRPTDRKSVHIRRGTVGVSAINLPPALRAHFGAPEDAGAMISEVLPGSPAEAAGFMLGDVVYEVAGETIESAADLVRVVDGGGVGNELEFTLARSGVEVILEAMVDVRDMKPKKP